MAAPHARADGYPDQPVTIVCPYGAGTGIDVVARVIAQELGESLKQSVVVRNQPGASGNIGAMMVANAKPDGYTFGIIANSHLINAHVSKNVVDVKKSFVPIATAGTAPYVLAVTSSLPVNSIDDLVAMAKKHPGQLNFSGIYGSVPQFLGIALKSAGNIDIRFISYKSTTDATVDAISGRVPIWFTTLASALPLVQSKKVKLLAVTGRERSPLIPDTPTVYEAGYPTLDLGSEFYFLAPAGTPAPIVAKLNHEIVAAMQSDEVRKKLSEQGIRATAGTPRQVGELLDREALQFGDLAKMAGIESP